MQEIKSIKLKFEKYIHQTSSAYLIKFMHQNIWLPKRLCRGFAVHGNDMHGVVSIPVFLYEKITGNTVDGEFCSSYAETDYIITKHKPHKIQPIKSEANAELTRYPNRSL